MATKIQKIKNYRELDELLTTHIHVCPTRTVKLNALLAASATFLNKQTEYLSKLFEDYDLSGTNNHKQLSVDVIPYWNALKRVQETLSTSKFKDFLRDGLNFSDVAIKNFITQLEEQNNFTSYIGTIFNLVKNNNFKSETIKECRESEAGYKAIYSTAQPIATDDPFATLLVGIQKYRTSENAEFFAKLELYIKSGHAKNDYTTVASRKRQHFDAKQAIFNLNAYFENNTKDASKLDELREAFDNRFNELFESVKITGSNEKREAILEGKIGQIGKSATGTAMQRRVDAFIRDAKDPSVVYAAVVTSSATAYEGEGNQFRIHAKAIEKAITENQMGSNVKTIIWHFVYPSLLSEVDQKGRGKKFQTSFSATGLSEQEVETINILPVLAGIATHKDVSVLKDLNICLIGGKTDYWAIEMKNSNNIDDVEYAVARNTASALAILSTTRRSTDFNTSNIPYTVVNALARLLPVINKTFKPDNWLKAFDHQLIDRAINGLQKLNTSDTTFTYGLEAILENMKSRLEKNLQNEITYGNS